MQFSNLATPPVTASGQLDVPQLRQLFPFYEAVDRARAGGAAAPVYLDAAATSQRPQAVLAAEYEFAAFKNAAVHRGTSAATGVATDAFESARERVANFLGCGDSYTLVWQAGATDALNTLAFAFSEATVAAAADPHSPARRFALDGSSEIVVTVAEHHANLVPWQRLAARTGAKLVVVPVTAAGIWELDALRQRLSPRTRVVAFTHLSNVTGWLSPVQDVVQLVAQLTGGNAVTVLDACQSVPHLPFDVAALGVDFAVFSGHKMYAPNGIGGLLGKTELLQLLPPAKTGGSAITKVTAEAAEFLPPPHRFEPGTQPVSQVIGLGAAVDFISAIGMPLLAQREQQLSDYLYQRLAELPGVNLLGPATSRAGLVAFTLTGVHPHDASQVLDTNDVVVRVGHHCAQPLHRALGINSSVRASISAATTTVEIDMLIAGIRDVQKYFGVQ
ncbi:cysteine desulfurase [Leucobacter sp. OH2974_COT-288]|uniref:cysteine desulfurase n=2 Tax=Canibacter oris TaxID=1365628 RepID=A0A840DL01_9MICO|nr:cysteine desulfurase [Canibacter oris]MBB4072152.1 cysteine desulfurase/selenocysteine lyase [Canibacter oris]RRD36628.1 cysteine desulfurase [Leucobacter sp. OH2974_COT-288]